MSSSNSNFNSTYNSMAYEKLTGLKPSAMRDPKMIYPNGGGGTSSTGVMSPTTHNNGTSQWAVGMANACDVLGNLGMTPSVDPHNTLSRNTTWDIPRATCDAFHRNIPPNNVEVLGEHKQRSRSSKQTYVSNVNNSWSSAGEKRLSGSCSSSNSINHSKGGSDTDSSMLLPNSASQKLTSNSLVSDPVVSKPHPRVSETECPRFYSPSYSNSKENDFLTSNLLSGCSTLSYADALQSNLGESFSNSRSVHNNLEFNQSSIPKSCSSGSSGIQESRSSTPSSNSNSLTKKKTRQAEECSLDDQELSASSPYFHLPKSGLDQLEVLSDSGSSLSPDLGHDSDSINTELDVGSMVEIVIKGMPRFGVIQWLGTISDGKKEGRVVAGIELEDGSDGLSDGTFNGRRHFSCPPGKAIFVNLSLCRQDSRFLETLSSANPRASIAFGSEDCGPVEGRVAPPRGSSVLAMIGRNKGIQGHQNSCYLDATLFSMFAFTSVFDSLLFRPSTHGDIKEYSEVQNVLREEIVNPLRSRMFVRADRIMKLRKLLDGLSSVKGLTTEEKDPEEFLHSLLAQILKEEPYLHLSSGQQAYHYQLFLEKDDNVAMPSVQQLFDQSFLTSDIKLKEVPSILILQMPRFGKDYKMYPRILPSLLLDITDVIEDSPRQCNICGQVAEFECPQCFGQCGSGLESIAFCDNCLRTVHNHKERDRHESVRKLCVPLEYRMLASHCPSVPRIFMELFAVVCIETSHYVTFTRCGEGPEAPWCFFDSMADRKGEQHGYNIPSVVECRELQEWLSDQGSLALSAITDDKALPHLTRRLLCDAYMCFYHTARVAMYR
ncbi:ubiquitin carboxyl-terminal hydrolase CYLD isoform X2 [Hyalella azteca]|uniref:ubiquitinyl hydrolase 1 n=1 Tax=Hyalella azteca TaxID=294128 RepID=A0A8B7NQ45_HYAAZ|nr:ubiquitin carboxyl-terminal hydrolase CYLD isoform X2 [Hyalella azteca]